MLLNYLKLSLRLLIRNPFFTFINVAGLSVGFVAFFIFWLHSTSELRSDQYHKDFERMARIGAHWRWVEPNGHEGMLVWGNLVAYQTGLIFSDFPEIEEHCRFINKDGEDLLFAVEGKNGVNAFKETRVVAADPNLFEFFTIPLVRGDKRTLLKNANSVVLSQNAAKRYFGAEDPVNRLLKLNDTTTLVVTGVFKDLPRATHLNFDIVLSTVEIERQLTDDSNLQNIETYVKLSGADDFEKLADKLNQNKQRYWGVLEKAYAPGRGDMFVQPLREIAYSNFSGSGIAFTPKSRPALFIMQAISIVILVMAWINYLNLTVSRIAKRSKEIATRKVSGAHHQDFMKQFLMESLLLNGISLAMAFTIVQLIRQPFQIIFKMQVPEFFDIPTATWLAIFTFIVTGLLITALYPAFLSLRYNPRKLQIRQSNPAFTRILPSALTTFQYGTAGVLISWTFVIYSQLTYLLDKDFLKKDQVMVVEAPLVKSASFLTDVNAFLNEARSRNSVTFSNSIIGDRNGYRFGIKRPEQEAFHYYTCDGGVDDTFLPFFGIELLAGRNFQPSDRADAMLISRIACARMGFTDLSEAIGAQLQLILMGQPDSEPKVLEVVGVYEDYPMTDNISRGDDANAPEEGTCLVFKNGLVPDMFPERIEILVSRENFTEALSSARESFRKIFPGSIFNWYFLDYHINAAYNNEKVIRNQITLFTGLAIGIACLGLLGMITNKADEKVKEIGIRKVLGASMRQIGALLLNNTFRQVTVAVLLSTPIAFYLGQDYLQRYTDRIKMQWWHFTSPIAILMLILLSTVIVVLYKAAKSNPVEALKYE